MGVFLRKIAYSSLFISFATLTSVPTNASDSEMTPKIVNNQVNPNQNSQPFLFKFPSTNSLQIAQSDKVWRVMPLGDSLTEGDTLSGHQSYRGHLYNLLQQNGLKVDFIGPRNKPTVAGGANADGDHGGFGGYSIGPDSSKFCDTCPNSNIIENLDVILREQADVILVLIGINDVLAAPTRPIRPEDAPAKLENLIQQIRQRQPNAKILVASLAKTGFEVEKKQVYDEVNKKARDLGERDPGDNVFFVDINAVSLQDDDFTDRLHFTNTGAYKIADAWYKALIPFLK
jgi:lysophospholipase L1-like esterase